MGFFSWKCSKSKRSIAAYPYAGRPVEDSMIVLVLPDDTTITGVYDGYGHIRTDEGWTYGIYDLVAQHYYNNKAATKDRLFNSKKYLTSPDGRQFTTEQLMYNEPIKEFGKSLNELVAEGYKIETDFTRSEHLVRLVRKDQYNGERFCDLQASESCEHQGFFYDEEVNDEEIIDEY